MPQAQQQSPEDLAAMQNAAMAQAINIINSSYPIIGKDLRVDPVLQADGNTVTANIVPLTPKGRDFLESYLAKHMPGLTRKDTDDEKKTEPTSKT